MDIVPSKRGRTAGKALPYTLIGLGAASLLAAALLPTVITPMFKKIPTDMSVTTIATAPAGATVLDSAALQKGKVVIETGVPIRSQRHVTTRPAYGTDNAVVFESGFVNMRTDKPEPEGLLSASVQKLTVDRNTGEPVGTTGSIDASPFSLVAPLVEHEGLTFKFPFDTQPTSYPYFDLLARTSNDLEFVEETEVDGLPVYHLRQVVGPVDTTTVPSAPTASLEMPASTWGFSNSDEMVTLHRIYSTTRDLWVEPRTGMIVKGNEHSRQHWARGVDAPESEQIVLLDMEAGFDQPTIDQQLALARKYMRLIDIGTVYAPAAAGIAGIGLIGAGGWLLRKRRTVQA